MVPMGAGEEWSCYALADTMDCLRAAASVTTVVLYADSYLLLAPMDEQQQQQKQDKEGEQKKQVVTQRWHNPQAYQKYEAVRSVPLPFAADTAPQGSLFYVASDEAHNAMLVYRWEAESAVPYARTLQWAPLADCLDPERWGSAWDACSPFAAKAFRFWLTMPHTSDDDTTTTSASTQATTDVPAMAPRTMTL